jgi:hypothetical protein
VIAPFNFPQILSTRDPLGDGPRRHHPVPVLGMPPTTSERTQVGIVGAGPAGLLLSQLRYVTTSRASATTLAENYCGHPPLRGGLLS